MKKIFSLLMMALLPMLASAGTNVIKVADIVAAPGSQVVMPIEVENEDVVRSVEFRCYLPAGVTEENVEFTSRSSDIPDNKKTVNWDASKNYLAFVIWGFDEDWHPAYLKGNNGSVANVTLQIGSNMQYGDYEIDVYKADLEGTEGMILQDKFKVKLTVQGSTNSITATDITARPGKTFTLPLNLENDDEITEAEFKLALPEGVTLESAKVTSRGNGHEVDYKLRAGKYNFEVFSEKGNAFSGTEGAFVELTLKADAGIAAGNYDIQVSDISLITADNKEVTVADFTAKLTIEEPTSSITASSIAAKAGKNIVLPINLENDNEITDMEFKLTLPAEVTLEGAAVTDRGADQEVSYKLRSGSYKFEVSSPAGQPFSGTEGAAVNITLKTDKTTAAGDYDILVSDILLVTKDGKEISVKDFTVKLSLTEWKEITVEDITKLIDEYLEQ
ncbi:MAG: hypothetical protein IJV06_08630 [Bacteroidaceae bacterium]|nr:hypothetical protein [Bacteroidaceae bacterium]